ncbi:hypothetical protein MVES1_000092 [Malassezia vespertilionis]|uniref:Ketoreductase domain-containing protein n=1 Tax=Malassezia vespertilionis TaxID=2020962 RepID=A0A2N1JHJ5_9BASI|nr:uncharacterized protein MVES1_000092 [Malassezia vespertilionis]PKI86026.1 hypothetical protein MVES_000092 [Malassezia vespertilionis]WFD04768.1 hypothetical protein MVES1_000092 [Malassezia vespertilionis]
MAKKTVLISGGSRGLGFAMAKLLINGSEKIAPSNVVTLSRSFTDELRELAETPEGKSSLAVMQGDVTSLEDNKRAVQKAVSEFGQLNALILNAGILCADKLADLEHERFMHAINVNTASLIVTLQASLPELRKQHGNVVFVSSGSAVSGSSSWGAYSASKAAMNSIARTLATEETEVASFPVRPGVVDTNMQSEIRSAEHIAPEMRAKFVEMHKNGKLLPPEKPAHVLAALALGGTRNEPKNAQGVEIGATGTFCSWDDEALAQYQL